MSSLAIQLPDDLSQFVAASVQSGGYQDADALFVSLLTTFKDQVEAPLSDVESAKLVTLRADIQHAVDQADRGEVVQGFDVAAFLAERHREHEAGWEAWPQGFLEEIRIDDAAFERPSQRA
jgi:Arc/MetJ-type ribon-helix-helix transcriptional regulator